VFETIPLFAVDTVLLVLQEHNIKINTKTINTVLRIYTSCFCIGYNFAFRYFTLPLFMILLNYILNFPDCQIYLVAFVTNIFVKNFIALVDKSDKAVYNTFINLGRWP